MVVQHAAGVADQRKGILLLQILRDFFRVAAHYAGKAPRVELCERFAVMRQVYAADGMPIIGQQHHYQRTVILAERIKVQLRLCRRIISKAGDRRSRKAVTFQEKHVPSNKNPHSGLCGKILQIMAPPGRLRLDLTYPSGQVGTLQPDSRSRIEPLW